MNTILSQQTKKSSRKSTELSEKASKILSKKVRQETTSTKNTIGLETSLTKNTGKEMTTNSIGQVEKQYRKENRKNVLQVFHFTEPENAVIGKEKRRIVAVCKEDEYGNLHYGAAIFKRETSTDQSSKKGLTETATSTGKSSKKGLTETATSTGQFSKKGLRETATRRFTMCPVKISVKEGGDVKTQIRNAMLKHGVQDKKTLVEFRKERKTNAKKIKLEQHMKKEDKKEAKKLHTLSGQTVAL